MTPHEPPWKRLPDPARLAWPRTTERLLLRPFQRGDVAAVHDYRSREDVVRYLGHPPLDRDGVAQLMLSRTSPDGRTVLHLVALDRRTGVLVGDGLLGTRPSPALRGGPPTAPGREGSVGYCIHPQHTGAGLATELTVAMLDLLFVELGAHRVVARVFSEHEPSRRVLAKAGMRREATFVAAVRDREGRWLDDDSWAVLAEDWLGRAPQ